MNKKEFATLIAVIKAYYPREKTFNTQEQLQLWFELLQDIPADIAIMAIKKLAITEKWIPTISDIRQAAIDVQIGTSADWSQGWEEVQKAIKKYGHYQSDLALGTMSEITREVVKKMGFKNLCISESPSADRANFRMIYENTAARSNTANLIPTELHRQIEGKRKEFAKLASDTIVPLKIEFSEERKEPEYCTAPAEVLQKLRTLKA